MREVTYAQALNEALREELTKNPAVLVLGSGITSGGGYQVTKGLLEDFGSERIIDTPPSANSTVGLALGAAMNGACPVVEIEGAYLLRCMDTIANQLAVTDYMTASQYGSGVVIRTNIGFSKNQGPQLAQSFEAMLCQIPGLTVVYPATANDAKGLLKSAINHDLPVVFLENELLYDKTALIADSDLQLPLSKAKIQREGSDLTIITYGPMLKVCLSAAEYAATEEIECEVLDLLTLYPLDKETIVSSVIKTGKVLIVHQAHTSGGIGAEIAATIIESEAFDYLEAPIVRIGSKDVPIGYAGSVFEDTVPDTSDVLDAILELTC